MMKVSQEIHLKTLHRQARIRIVWILLSCVLVNRFCSMPTYFGFDFEYNFFPLNDKVVSFGYYVYAIGNCIQKILICYAITYIGSFVFDRWGGFMVPFFLVEFLSLVDFCLMYEWAWFFIGNYGFEYSDVKWIFYSLYGIFISWKWSTE